MSTKKIIPIEDNKLYFLFRRGKKEHIESLYYNGEIFINTVESMKSFDDNPQRTDKDEGLINRQYHEESEIIITEIGGKITDGLKLKATNFIFKQYTEEFGNIYCLTGIYTEDLIDLENDIILDTKSFGESSIFILNPREFINRIKSELQKQGFETIAYNKVKYYDNEFSGKITPFHKHIYFKSQKEYRIFVKNTENKPIKISIGSIEDISKLTSKDIVLKYSDEREQKIIV